MNILKDIGSFLNGGLFDSIKEAVFSYFPPDMSEKEKADLQIKIDRMLHDQKLKANKVLNDASLQLDKRIAEQEGTAKDLRELPFLGRIILFLRGSQRPVWGYATLYMDYKWFFEGLDFSEQQQTAMIVINILVLGFLFGERTIKNLEPLIIKVFGRNV